MFTLLLSLLHGHRSILPSATQQWQADKTLYYSPIGATAGTAPHKFPSQLREVRLMHDTQPLGDMHGAHDRPQP